MVPPFEEAAETPELKGPDIHVFKEGRLWLKQSFLRPRRVCVVDLHGLRFRITMFNPRRTETYMLNDAVMQAHVSSLKFLLRLRDGETLQLHAEHMEDFKDWVDALKDVLNWSFEYFYNVAEILGRGSFAVVKRARHRATNDDVAVKIIKKTRCSEDEFKCLQREIDIALTLRHPNVVRTSDLFQSKSKLYIVFELMRGGTLQTAVECNGPFSEGENKIIMSDLFKAIKHIHSKGIVHRDVKPANILCTSQKPPMTVKLIDFGLARRISVKNRSTEAPYTSLDIVNPDSEDDGLGPQGLMTTPVGTPHFVAPEVLCSLPYSKEVDLFACGVILFWLLSGFFPFEDANVTQLVERIKKVEYDFGHVIWDGISDSAKDLVSQLLQRSPFERISVTDALSHPWFGDSVHAPPRLQFHSDFDNIATQNQRQGPISDDGDAGQRWATIKESDSGGSSFPSCSEHLPFHRRDLESQLTYSNSSKALPVTSPVSPITPDGEDTIKSSPFRNDIQF